ncbi:MAG: oligosaccharide flippase family protein [Actinomycetota bacterium]|nr:oligosaccharide flippase family protein [Actinomycetota bacterium]
MLIGRVLAMAVAFLTQIIVVRHLTKSDYGVFAYAFSAALLLQSVLALGVDRADTRFLAEYEHRRDHARLLGVIVLEAAVVLVLGAVSVGVVWVFRDALGGPAGHAHVGRDVLVIMIALAPIQALDVLVVNVFAVFASPWSVFFRRFVLAPALRLLVAVALVITGSGPTFLAAGYLLAGIVGVGVYLVLLVRLLRQRGFLPRRSLPTVTLPVRELLSFSLPLLFTNLVAVAATELAPVVLGRFREASDVAALRAVQPFAALNLVVMLSFATLFTPSAARLQARGDMAGLRALYWQSACWVAVLTFPILCVTTALARPVTVIALGDRYEASALYVGIFAVGYYVNAALGFNGITLQMLGRVRYVLVMNVVVLAWMIAANLVFIPRWGAVGAVVAVLTTLIVHNVGKQVGLGFGAVVGIVDRRHLRVVLTIVAAALCVNAVVVTLNPPLPVGLVLVAAATLAVVRAAAGTLEVAVMLPELARLPVIRWLFVPR